MLGTDELDQLMESWLKNEITRLKVLKFSHLYETADFFLPCVQRALICIYMYAASCLCI